MSERKEFGTYAAIACWLLLIISLLNPAFHLRGGGEVSGLGAFVLGWLGFESFGNLSWLANPPFLVATLLLTQGSFRFSLILAGIAMALALTSLELQTVSLNATGSKREIVAFGKGYYIWISAIALCIGLSVTLGRVYSKAKHAENQAL